MPTPLVDVTNQVSIGPWDATLDGRPVRIVLAGNQAGKSPVFGYLGEDQRVDYDSQSKFVITDRACQIATMTPQHTTR